VVALDVLAAGAAGWKELGGVVPLVCRGESDFAMHFARAFLAGGPAVIVVEAAGHVASTRPQALTRHHPSPEAHE
jgi:hypothetical protein